MKAREDAATMRSPPIKEDLAEGAIVRLAPLQNRLINCDGREIVRPDTGVRLRYHAIGDLALPTGRLIVCDPDYARDDPAPFSRPVEPGTFQVEAITAEVSSGEQRVAFGVLRLSPSQPERWEPANLVGEEDVTLDGPFCAFGVDSATACFVDAGFVGRISARCSDQLGDDERSRMVSLPGDGGANLALFLSGFGDGSYSSFWGLDGDGTACCLVTDFDVVANSIYAPAIKRSKVGESFVEYLDAKKTWWKFWKR